MGNFNPRTREGCDRDARSDRDADGFQSTHPRGVRPVVSVAAVSADGFQSTHPMRGATGTDTLLINIPEDFNPRTPCGVRLCVMRPIIRETWHFNPRTPCGVRLCVMRPIIRETWHFNPRTPCGVRPGSDPDRRVQGHFNPRTPCGVRLPVCSFRTAVSGFQSTHPMRGATKLLQYTAPIK